MASKNLIIVESPTKAKTISRLLGKDYWTLSSQGHVVDLPPDEFAVDVENNFAVNYKIIKGKGKIVKMLKSAVKKADKVYLGTDEDREGEAISWHLCRLLGIPSEDNVRITFHEITKRAIENALKNSRPINIALVNAQQCRRILDRIVGYELSPLMWEKISGAKSAGRVQSATLKLIVDRENEIRNFVPSIKIKLYGEFYLKEGDKNKTIKGRCDKTLESIEEARTLIKRICGKEFIVIDSNESEEERKPSPPYITSTLQQDANRYLGLSVSETMRIAQYLYETGKITYMRTDSVHLAPEAVSAIKKFIIENYGEDYSHPRQFHTTSAHAQEAHEAIRPTNVYVTELKNEKKNVSNLYHMIWRRTVASQMANAIYKKQLIIFTPDGEDLPFSSIFKTLIFDGFLKLWDKDSEKESDEKVSDEILPKKGQILLPLLLTAEEEYTNPPSRFTEATLVKEMERTGIGRPSTYASIVSLLFNRRYVEKKNIKPQLKKIKVISWKRDSQAFEEIEKEIRYGEEKNRIVPTPLGEEVVKYLFERFPKIVDISFTAEMEKKLDLIAQNSINYLDVLREFYKEFKELLIQAKSDKYESRLFKVLGTHPESKKPIYLKYSTNGPYLQVGEPNLDNESPKFYPIPHYAYNKEISYDDALFLISLPREVANLNGIPIILKCDNKNFFLNYGNKKIYLTGENPQTLTQEEIIQIVLNMTATKGKPILVKEEKILDKPVKIMIGKYGPYIAIGNKNIPLPKTCDPSQLSVDEIKKYVK